MQYPLQSKEIIKYLKDNIEPLKDNIYEYGYRASVYLTDGTYLPCVIFRNSPKVTTLAITRFEEEKSGIFGKNPEIGYYNIVKSFVANGNCLNRYAFPIQILKQIQGETTMSWTCFISKMKDGTNIGFGTTFRTEFFDMPSGYSANDIIEIENHSYISESGRIYRYYEHPLYKF